MVLIDRLDEETFGEQLRRARARRRWNARDVADRLSGCWPVSHTLIHRLETEPTVPTEKRRRIIAALYAIALGYEPAVFGLSRDDIPPAIDVSALAPDLVSGCESMTCQAGRPMLRLVAASAAA
jgi:transcriptional regulator with XRE-family HTH domain